MLTHTPTYNIHIVTKRSQAPIIITKNINLDRRNALSRIDKQPFSSSKMSEILD